MVKFDTLSLRTRSSLHPSVSMMGANCLGEGVACLPGTYWLWLWCAVAEEEDVKRGEEKMRKKARIYTCISFHKCTHTHTHTHTPTHTLQHTKHTCQRLQTGGQSGVRRAAADADGGQIHAMVFGDDHNVVAGDVDPEKRKKK